MNANRDLTSRLIVLTCCFLGAAALGARARRPEIVPPRAPLTDMPSQLGVWTGQEAPPFADDVLATLGVDEYINRVYTRADGAAVALYVGYYGSQRQGDSIHSPLNCLPGAGWQEVSRTPLSVAAAGTVGSATINRLIVEKGLDRQVVLYWYQSHGRIVASEYRSKAYLVLDAIRRNRSDAALVRVVSPVLTTDRAAADATDRARAFVTELFPQLERFLPS